MNTENDNFSINNGDNFYNRKALNYYCSQCMLYRSLEPLYNITLLINFITLNREAGIKLTPAELAAFDGSNGRPAYVAVNGIIYDVSNSPSWGGGTHFGIYSGKDASAYFKNCHKTDTVLSELPRIGILEVK